MYGVASLSSNTGVVLPRPLSSAGSPSIAVSVYAFALLRQDQHHPKVRGYYYGHQAQRAFLDETTNCLANALKSFIKAVKDLINNLKGLGRP